jgi:glycine/D-amino acid oxidase-like deaminating enzyme
MDVIVVDARIPGSGSTAASSALLMFDLDLSLTDLADAIGLPNAELAYRLSLDALHLTEELCRRVADCGFARRQSLNLASRRRAVRGLRAEAELRAGAGFSTELWTEEEVRERAGIVAEAAMLSPEGAVVDALRFTRGLLHQADAAGARIYGRTMVTELECGTRVRAGTNSEGSIDAGIVVLATGYELPAGVEAPTVRVHSTYMVITEPTIRSAGLDGFLCWDTNRPYFYLRTTDDRRIMIGGADLRFRDPATRDSLLPTRAKRLTGRLRQLLGESPPPIAFSWTGTFADTTDGLPLIGAHPTMPNVLLALGYGGNGITFSALAAEMLDHRIRGLAHRGDRLFAPDRPSHG